MVLDSIIHLKTNKGDFSSLFSKMESSRQPSKSILKDNTLPILNSKRRVSFAPEVTLHKFDFVPYPNNKRRKTIGVIPSSESESSSSLKENESEDNGIEVLEDSSDDEGTVGTDADVNKAISDINTLNDSQNDNNEFEDEEETMDLTGQISYPRHHQGPETASESREAQPVEIKKAQDEIESEHQQRQKEYANGETQKEESDSQRLQSSPFIEAPQLSSSEDESEEEVEMELTGVVKVNVPQHRHQESFEQTAHNHAEEEVTMDLTTYYNKAVSIIIKEDEEMSMDLTAVYSYNKHNQSISEFNKEMSENLKELQTVSEIGKNENKNQTDDDGEEIPMEITQPLNKVDLDNEQNESIKKFINNIESESIGDFSIKEIYKDNDEASSKKNEEVSETLSVNEELFQHSQIEYTQEFEQTMDITHLPNKIEKSLPEEAEVTMDLTQVKGKIEIPSTVENVNDLEKETIQLPKDSNSINEYQNNNEDNHITLPEASDVETSQENSNDTIEKPQSIEFISAPETKVETGSSPGKLVVSPPMQLTQATKSLIIENDVPSSLELTQNNTSTQDKDEKNDNNNDVSEVKEYDHVTNNKNEELVSTTTIPLADVTNDYNGEIAEDDDYIPVTLNDFMNDIGIKFYDDLDIDIDSINRLSFSLTDEHSTFKLQDYFRAIPKLQLLTLYEFSCEELSKNIQEGKKVFAEFNKTIETNNPQLFREYYLSDENEKINLNMKLQLVKDYTRFQSKKTWHEWRTQLTKNLITELDDKYHELINDKANLLKNLSSIDKIFVQVKLIHENLKKKLDNLVNLDNQLKGFAIGELIVLKNELTEISIKLAHTKEEINAKQRELTEVNNQITESSELKSKLNKVLVKNEKILNNNKKYETDEINLLNLQFRLLQKLSNLKFIKSFEKVFHFKFDNLINIKINFEDIYNLSNITYAIQENNISPILHNTFLLNNYPLRLSELMPSSNIIENFENFKNLWEKLKSLDNDIFKISLKFPIKFVEVNDSNLVKFQIKYFNSTLGFKVLFNCVLDIQQLLNYPQNLKIEGEIRRSKINLTNESIKNYLVNDIVKNNLITFDNIKEINLI